MATSQNGWPVLTSTRRDGPLPRLRAWRLPGTDLVIPLRDGSAGFVLMHFLLWWHETIESVTGRVLDDWGYASRPVTGGVVPSNHASGTALDINATRHVLGRAPEVSLPAASVTRIRKRLGWARYRSVLRWGGDYNGRKDVMHVELVRPIGMVQAVARILMQTPRGRRLLKANAGAREVILT